jgi:hypothetical protein
VKVHRRRLDARFVEGVDLDSPQRDLFFDGSVGEDQAAITGAKTTTLP